MTEHYDKLETRSAGERDNDLVTSIGAQLVHGEKNVPYYASSLEDYDCRGF